jgi:hypothetical protein
MNVPHIPAVLMWFDSLSAPPVQHPTAAPTHMCSDVAEAVAFLAADKPAMVAADDAGAVLRALEHAEPVQ